MNDILNIDKILDELLHSDKIDKLATKYKKITEEINVFDEQLQSLKAEHAALASEIKSTEAEITALSQPGDDESKQKLNSLLHEKLSQSKKLNSKILITSDRIKDLSSVDLLGIIVEIYKSYLSDCESEIRARHDSATEKRILQELQTLRRTDDKFSNMSGKLVTELELTKKALPRDAAAEKDIESRLNSLNLSAAQNGERIKSLNAELAILLESEKAASREYFDRKDRYTLEFDRYLIRLREALQDKKIRRRRHSIPNYRRLQNRKISGLSRQIFSVGKNIAHTRQKLEENLCNVSSYTSEEASLRQQLDEFYLKENDEIKLIKKEIAVITGNLQQANDKVAELKAAGQLEETARLAGGNLSPLRNEIALIKSEINEYENTISLYKTEAKREGRIKKEVSKLEESEQKKRKLLEDKTGSGDSYLKSELEDILKQKAEATKELEDFQRAETEEVRIMIEKKAVLEAELKPLMEKLNESAVSLNEKQNLHDTAETNELTKLTLHVQSLNDELTLAKKKLSDVKGKQREHAKTDNTTQELAEFEQNLAGLEKRYEKVKSNLADEKAAREKNEANLSKLAEKKIKFEGDLSHEKLNIKWQKDNRQFAKQMDTKEKLLVVKNLKKYFPVEKNFLGRPTRYLRAVDDVSFAVAKGRTMGIVGESGCGKTTMGRAILKLNEITDGEVIFEGNHVEILNNREMQVLRPQMQIIFQDPYSSLSPRLPVGEIIGEAVRAHKLVPKNDYRDYIMETMKRCGLQTHYFSRYPHEFSGGQRQRICIARALALNPKLVICDEPVSALDVSIQAQIINLLEDLQRSNQLTYVFISHDLSVVEHISDDVGVMYLGSMVESGMKKKVFDNPMHPYTEALFSAVPVPDPNIKMKRIVLKGDIPSPANPPRGCKFHTRCHRCMDVCKEIPPIYKEYEPDHFVACHLYPQE